MDASTLQILTAIVAVIGPFLTYAGVRYQQKDKLEELARRIVADTLEMQAKKIEALERAEEEDKRTFHALRMSYQAIRSSLLTVREKTKIIATRLEELFASADPAKLKPVRASFDDLLATLDDLAESTDPLDTAPGGKRSPILTPGSAE